MIDYINFVLNQAVTQKFVEPDTYTFRGSQLPYCGTRDFLSACQRHSGSLPNKLIPYKLQNMADIGTAMHKTIQKALANMNCLFGNWDCPHCNKKIETSMPIRCCGEIMTYREITVHDPSIKFSGSADALIPKQNGGLYLLDFKTKDPKKLKALGLLDNNRLQVCAYRYYLTRPPWNLDIRGAAIAYLGRQDMPELKVVPIPEDEFADFEFERARRNRQTTLHSLQTGDVDSLHKQCRSQTDNVYCPYNMYCFGGNSLQSYLKNEWQKSQLAQHTKKAP
jgi:hypothetical protein